MKYLPLLWSNLARRKTRTLFTLLSVTAAFTLFGLLVAIRQGFLGDLDIVGGNRLVMSPKVFATGALPISYRNKIARLAGVEAVLPMSGFGAYYRDKKNSFVALAVNPAAMHAVYPEAETVAGSAAAWDGDRIGAMVGVDLAHKYGWHVGDRIPINARGEYGMHKDGSRTWDIKIDALYHINWGGRFNSYLFMHYKYFNEGRALGADSVVNYTIRIADPAQAGTTSRKIDSLFVNAAPQTDTQPEKAQVRDYLEQFGNVGAIVIAIAVAVFFSMLLVVANTMGQAVRERTAELATLKALGFGDRGMVALVLGESLLVTGVGGGIGLALSYGLVEYLKPQLVQFFNTFDYSSAAVVIGVALIIAFGLIAGLLPALEVARLRITTALRRA